MPLELHRGPAFGRAHRIARNRWRVSGGLLVVRDREIATSVLRGEARGGAVVGREAVTPAELRRRVIAAAGRPPSEPPSAIGVRLALQEIVRSRIWPGFAGVAEAPGFISAAERALTELRTARIGVRELAAAAAASTPLARDLAELHEAAWGVLLPVDLHWQAADAAAGLEAFPPVVVDGFDDLDPPAWALLAALGRICDVTVAMVHMPGRRAFAARDERQAAWAQAADRVEDHGLDPEVTRPPGLAALDAALHEDLSGGPVGDGGEIRFVEAAGTVGMYRAALEELLTAHRAGVPLGECALVVPYLARARADLDRLLAAWDVPARRRTRVRFIEAPIGLALIGLLRLGELERDDPAALAPLLAWLRTPYSGADPDDVDRLEVAARGAGRTARAELMARYDDEAMVPARALVAASRQGPRAQVALLMDSGWRGLRRASGAADRPVAADRRDAEALRTLAGVAAGFDEGEPEADGRARGPLPAGALGQILADLTLADDSGPADGLWVGDYAALRGRRFRVVALTGLDGDGFPGRPAPDPMLADLRDELADRLVPRAPGTTEHRLRMLQAVAAAGERLVLVRRIVDDDGREVAPSPYWVDAIRVLDREPAAVDRRAGRRGELVDDAAAAPTEREALRAIAVDGRVAPGRLERAASRRVRRLGVAPDAFDHLDRVSVTALEQYLRCPYGWLLDGYLRPTELQQSWDPRAEGGLLHAIIQGVFERARDDGVGQLTTATLPRYREYLATTVQEAFTAASVPAGEEVAVEVFRQRAPLVLGELLIGLAELGVAMEPVFLETTFRDPDLLGAFDPELALSGKADRIDADAGGRVVAVDYKRSGADFKLSGDVIDLQLPLYAHVAARVLAGRRGGHAEPVGGLYIGLTTPRITGAVSEDAGYAANPPKGVVVERGEWATILGEALEAARSAARGIREGRLDPPSEEPCRWCTRGARNCEALWR